jgi:hypothetical protein
LFAKLLCSSLSLHFLFFNAKGVHLLNEQSLVKEIGYGAEEQSCSEDASNFCVAGHIFKVHKGKLGLTKAGTDLLFTFSAHIFTQLLDIICHNLLCGVKVDWSLGLLRDFALPLKLFPINFE